ncbi:CDP-diacylglycerol--glycerol-3-phosphate 3-phosphatidyltransferase [Streptomyces sp. HPF1205]|uniref:CDP-diacylglycerol--glycerol-3-phosphate 3-phosphatidyltransferase n=1 Tax=Streptomyces sp. HPF1205 TaxID=2873262 RepID=UPI001CED194E|nr:CDP-diacylglycerol--glycerol-3-phosphate 3-phosphatidyltransferase [Streptomyces sp. HPF1205]
MSEAPAAPAGPAGPPGSAGPPAAAKPGLWNVANLLTMIRLALVPGFVVLLLHGDGHDPAWRSFAWAAFGVAMITDLFDGELARRYGLVTDFGKIADPIADKAIMGAALIGLSGLGDLPWWVTVVILVRELGITLMRFWVIRFGVIPASRGGKLKTLTQGVGVGMYILILTGPLASLRAWIMAVAVILTVATGLDYVRQAVVLRRAGLIRRRAAGRARERGRAQEPEREPAVAAASADERGRTGPGGAGVRKGAPVAGGAAAAAAPGQPSENGQNAVSGAEGVTEAVSGAAAAAERQQGV